MGVDPRPPRIGLAALLKLTDIHEWLPQPGRFTRANPKSIRLKPDDEQSVKDACRRADKGRQRSAATYPPALLEVRQAVETRPGSSEDRRVGSSGDEPPEELQHLFERHRDADAARDYDAILVTFIEDCCGFSDGPGWSRTTDLRIMSPLL